MTEDDTEVQVIVSKAYGPNGDNLVGVSDVTFDGFPAVTLLVETPDGRSGEVHLSPIHGDERKTGFVDISPGTRCTLKCPVSGDLLKRVEDIDDRFGAGYYAIYRTPELADSSMIMISDVWGHYHSRIVNNFELIATWGDLHDELKE